MVRLSRVPIVALALVLATSACTMKKTDQPVLSGPSEFALSLALYANPDTVVQDGVSQSVVVVQARDSSGQPVKNLTLRVGLAVNNTVTSPGLLSATSVTTDSDGRATVLYTAPPAPAGNVDLGTIVTLSVTPTGTDYNGDVTRNVQVRLVPPTGSTSGPVANFTYSPVSPVPYTTVTFDASASTGVQPLFYAWDFGDSTTPGSGVSARHLYRQAGTYQVTLRVTDARNVSNPLTQPVTVGQAAVPTATFVISPTAPAPGDGVFFNASTSHAATGHTLVAYSWNFGDGSRPVTGITATTVYVTAGTFVVTLTVTDDVGQTASVAQSVTVK